MTSSSKKITIAYTGILAVVFFWAIMPILKKILIGDHFSASVYSTITAFASGLVLLCLNAKQLKKLNPQYFKVAVPTGLCLGGAALTQALAFNFNASPTNQAFLENLSCVIVPVLLFLLIRKKPSMMTVTASLLCLVSSMVLSGVFQNFLGFSAADILNALAGLLYGLNIALTGIYAKKFVPSLYVMIQLFVQAILSLIMAVAFHFLIIGGAPVDPFVFTPKLLPLLALIGVGIVSNAVCWTIRTTAMKYVSASVVAVIMPFSAVVTSVIAVLSGQDSPTWSLLLGAILGITASLLSAAGDIAESKNEAADRSAE